MLQYYNTSSRLGFSININVTSCFKAKQGHCNTSHNSSMLAIRKSGGFVGAIIFNFNNFICGSCVNPDYVEHHNRQNNHIKICKKK